MPTGEIRVPIAVPFGGERGDIPDHQLDANYFRQVQNMYVDEQGRLTLRDGYEQVASSGPGGRIMGLAHFRTAAGADRTVATNRTEIHTFDGTSWTDRTGSTALSASTTQLSRFQVFPTSGVFSIIHVNGKDDPQTWNGSASTFSDLGGSPPVAIDIAAAANRVLLLINPDNVRISDFNDPGTWPVLNTVRLTDTGDRMIGMERIGRLAVAIYGEGSQWVARAQVGSFPVRFEKVDEKPGPISNACVVPDGNVHYYLGIDGIVYQFNGVNVVPWHRGMQNYVKTELNFGNRAMSHGVLIRRIRHIFWFFPNTGAPNRGVYLDLDRRAMGRLSFGEITASAQWATVALTTWNSLSSYTWTNISGTYASWNSFGGAAEQRELLGDSSGQVHAFGSGQGGDNGNAIEGVWELPLRPWAGPEMSFIPLEFETYFRQTTNSTTIEPGARVSDTLMTDPSVTALANFDITTDQRNSIDLSSVAGADGKKFVSIRHRVSTSKEGGKVSWLGGVLSGSGSEVTGGPYGTT